MPQYYFDVKDSVPIRDRTGADLANETQAITFAQKIADSLRAEGVGGEWFVSVVREDGSEVLQIKIDGESERPTLN